VLDKSDHLHLGGDATPVDWLIKMHRVPMRLMFDFAIAHQSASTYDAARIAQSLAGFYQSLPAERLAPQAYRARFRRQIEASRAEFLDAAYGLASSHTGTLCDAQSEALLALGGLLDERTAAGALVEGHGDLRPEHVCLLPEIAIIDCLEFSRELRMLDKADEVAYLALECEYLGATEIADAFTGAYRQYSGDRPAPALVHFYQSCRASKRALLAVRHLKEEKFRYSSHWQHLASAYLLLAQDHALACQAR
jgi:aminoglycoside phosphotransferase family enzyme